MRDFFERQEQARRNTAVLVIMFICAVILTVLTVYLAVTTGLYVTQIFMTQGESWFIHDFYDLDRFLWIVAITSVIVTTGSLYRTHQLKQGGGAAVAEMLGGARVPAASDDPLLRRLQNVVEEMAIASGLPVPPIYLMQQQGINAFAAGFGPRDAVIAVTSGALEMLTRDELQGVIAHEFSHILNGDTGLKMRLMGLLFGITLISDAGILMMTARHSSRRIRRDRGSHPAMIVTGFMVFMVGTIGAVFADMVKRAVSRQREFLADAAAVQFTRNPAGIAGALKVIGGYKVGSRVKHAATQQASHFFFGNAVKSWENNPWWATHPPLIERIRRLERGFRGEIRHINAANRSAFVMNEVLSGFADNRKVSPVLTAHVDTIMASIGNPGIAELQQARMLLARIPERLTELTRDPFGVRSVVYALLLDASPNIWKIQIKELQKQADSSVFRAMIIIHPVVERLDMELRIPLLEMTLPALKSLSKEQFDSFRLCVRTLIQADKKLDLFEYMMQRMLLRHLYPAYFETKPVAVHFDSVEEVVGEIAEIIAILIRNGSHVKANKVYQASMRLLIEGRLPAMPKPGEDMLSVLDQALKKMERASPEIKRSLLKACVFTILADGKTTVRENELLRTIADALDAPMPQVNLTGS